MRIACKADPISYTPTYTLQGYSPPTQRPILDFRIFLITKRLLVRGYNFGILLLRVQVLRKLLVGVRIIDWLTVGLRHWEWIGGAGTRL